MKRLSLVLSLVCFISMSATAFAQACYTPAEFEAEQGIRIHSELMVIGLTCMKMPQGQQMYMKYGQFTQKNQRLIAGYENDLINYFRKGGFPDPEKKFHTLRTDLANKISRHAINMSTASFCNAYGPRIDKALAMDQQKLRRWAQHVWPETPTLQPLCPKMAAVRR